MAKEIETNVDHEAFYQEFAQLLDKHAGQLPAVQMLAIASVALGRMVALQDQRKYTPSQIMEVVALNIEKGNADMLAKLMATKGNA